MKKLLCAGAVMAGLLASGCGGTDNSSSPVAADEYNASPTSPATPTEGETGMMSPGYSASPTSPIMMAPTGPAKIDVAETKLGKVLVGLEGRTLYLFTKDKAGTSMCTGACATAWPPALTLGAPTAGTGVKPELLKTIKRDDGMTQVVYNGHPLYYYAKDEKAGDVKGQDVKDFGGEWYAVTPEGKKAKQ
jgi:predicted lipoprotein with Yx(FWY)xxD motif